MNKIKHIETDNKLTVDINGLRAMLSVGRNSAMKAGKEAGAVIKIGRRTLYNVKKIEEYVNSMTEE